MFFNRLPHVSSLSSLLDVTRLREIDYFKVLQGDLGFPWQSNKPGVKACQLDLKKKVQNDMFHVLDFYKDGTALFLFAVIFKCHLFCSQFNIPRLDVSTLLTNTKSFTSGSSSVWTFALLHSGAGFITSSCVVRSASEFWNCTLEPTTSGWKRSGLRINYSGLLSLAERYMQGEI